jgi:hypothetical protein
MKAGNEGNFQTDYVDPTTLLQIYMKTKGFAGKI